jgi:hypothetical protein
MIPQIYITALITLIISLAFWRWPIYLFTGHQKRNFLAAGARLVYSDRIEAFSTVARTGIEQVKIKSSQLGK